VTGGWAESGRSGGSAGRDGFSRWPLPVGEVKTRHGLTFVSSAEPGGFSVEDLWRIPDDGRRVELLNGVAVVRPALTPAQQKIMRNLYVRLCDTSPKHLVPVDDQRDLRLGDATVLRPDIQVLPRDRDKDEADRPGMAGMFPELVVELRPDDGDSDERRAKMRGYRDAGIPSYWIVCPETATVAVYELKYIKRDSSVYRCDEVCERGRRYGWRLWAGTA
jgi:Uma2 family endonuclease